MFVLLEITIGMYAVIKDKKENSVVMPVEVFGFITISKYNNEYIANGWLVSQELLKSGQLGELKKTAIELTTEAVADEFGD